MCLCIYIHTFTYVWLKYISNVGILWRNWVSGIDIVGASTLFKDVRFPFVREKGYSYAGHIMPTPNSRVYSQCWLLTIVIMPSSHKRDTLMACYSNNNNTICHRENNRNILSYNSRMERQCFFYGSKTFFSVKAWTDYLLEQTWMWRPQFNGMSSTSNPSSRKSKY